MTPNQSPNYDFLQINDTRKMFNHPSHRAQPLVFLTDNPSSTTTSFVPDPTSSFVHASTSAPISSSVVSGPPRNTENPYLHPTHSWIPSSQSRVTVNLTPTITPMTTHKCHDIMKSINKLSLHVDSSSSPLPHNYFDAFRDPN